MKFVVRPNLPQNAENVIIAGNTPENILSELEKLGISYILSPEIPFATKGLSFHPDMQLAHMGNDRILVHKSAFEYYGKFIPAEVGESGNLGTYPDDVAYNVAIVGKHMICNEKYTDKKILGTFGGEIINVKQGYSKCSVAVVDENSVITSDDGIYAVLKGHNMNVLKIGQGHIELAGYEYGFIGGACGKLKKDLLAFTGNIKKHPYFTEIDSFCRNVGVYPYSLSNESLVDVGSILPLTEK